MIKSSSLPTPQKLRDYLHGRQEEMIALLAQLVTGGLPLQMLGLNKAQLYPSIQD